MTTDDLAAVEALLVADRLRSGDRTHWGGCHVEHVACAAWWLLRRVEELEVKLGRAVEELVERRVTRYIDDHEGMVTGADIDARERRERQRVAALLDGSTQEDGPHAPGSAAWRQEREGKWTDQEDGDG